MAQSIKFYGMIPLQTHRIIIREYQNTDFDSFATLMADPEVMRYSINGPILDREKVANYFQKRILDHYRARGYGLYAVENKQDHTIMGYVGLIDQKIDDEDKVELGYRLMPHYWGQGYAREACRAVCNYAAEILGLNDVIAIIDPLNQRSLAVAKALGMQLWRNAIFHSIPVEIYFLKLPVR